MFVDCDVWTSIQVFRNAATPYKKQDKVKLEEEVKQGRVKCDLSGNKENAREYSILRQETFRMSNRSERRKHNLTNVPETVQLPFWKYPYIYSNSNSRHFVPYTSLDKEITRRRYSQIDVESICWSLALIAWLAVAQWPQISFLFSFSESIIFYETVTNIINFWCVVLLWVKCLKWSGKCRANRERKNVKGEKTARE